MHRHGGDHESEQAQSNRCHHPPWLALGIARAAASQALAASGFLFQHPGRGTAEGCDVPNATYMAS